MNKDYGRLPENRLTTLDGLRGMAILMVLGTHFAYSGVLPEPPTRVSSVTHVLVFGWMGVDLFFVLSGFLITGILLNTKTCHNYFSSFYARRVLRIFPLYYLIILSIFALTLGRYLYPWWRPNLPPFSFLVANLAYGQNWWIGFHPSLRSASNSYWSLGAYWSLGVEEQFYLFWPIFVLKLGTRKLVALCLFICAATPLLRLWLLRQDPQSVMVFVSTLTRMDTLVWGALAAVVVRNPRFLQALKPYLNPIFVICASGVLFIAFPMHELYSRARLTQSIGYTVIAIGCTALLLKVYIADSSPGPLADCFKSRFLRSFGRYSYGMYIFHAFVLVGMTLAFKLRPSYGHSLPLAGLFLLLFLILTYATAATSLHLYESRFLRFKASFRPSPIRELKDPELPHHVTLTFDRLSPKRKKIALIPALFKLRPRYSSLKVVFSETNSDHR